MHYFDTEKAAKTAKAVQLFNAKPGGHGHMKLGISLLASRNMKIQFQMTFITNSKMHFRAQC